MESNYFSRIRNGSTFLLGKKTKEGRTVPARDRAKICVGTFEPGMRGTWLTVGVKLILGVGLISNLCMGGLIFTSWKATQEVKEKTNRLLELNSSLNAELRERITTILDKYLQIPDYLAVDPAAAIVKQIRQRFSIERQAVLEGRPAYGRLFKRKQRRDLSKGKFVVQAGQGQVVVSRGVFDVNGGFSDAVEMIYLTSSDPRGDLEKIRALILGAEAEAGGKDALKQKIVQLGEVLADEGLAADMDRTKILYHLDRIKAEEDELERIQTLGQRTMVVIAGITMTLNLLVLYALTFLLVERPLKRLTRAIELINQGKTSKEFIQIPYQGRKDRIGTLAGVLVSFQNALRERRAADRKKHEEQGLIQELILTMTDLIEDLRTKSQAMRDASYNLNELAKDTSEQSDTAFISITGTGENTQQVTLGADSLQKAVGHIHGQVERQNELEKEIDKVTCDSMVHIQELNTASREIGDIVKIVKKIAGQTRLLSLNARIEASRAGAAGKGFTVVAKEVRDLSIQTEAANLEIETKIVAIQKACRQMGHSTQGVETLIHTLSEAGSQIYGSVQNQQILSDRIAGNAEATTKNVHDLFKRISRVKEAARETRELSETVRAHSSNMEAGLDCLLTGTRNKLDRIGKNKSLTLC